MADMYVYDAKNPRHTKILYKRFVNQFISVQDPGQYTLPNEDLDGLRLLLVLAELKRLDAEEED